MSWATLGHCISLRRRSPEPSLGLQWLANGKLPTVRRRVSPASFSRSKTMAPPATLFCRMLARTNHSLELFYCQKASFSDERLEPVMEMSPKSKKILQPKPCGKMQFTVRSHTSGLNRIQRIHIVPGCMQLLTSSLTVALRHTYQVGVLPEASRSSSASMSLFTMRRCRRGSLRTHRTPLMSLG